MDSFPERAWIGSTPYGLDADHYDHRSHSRSVPELVVTEKPAGKIIWGPDGKSYRVVSNRQPFGFIDRT